MDIITTSLEALIQRATNVNNQGPDTAAIDAFCGLILKEPESAQIAAKFITSKVHSLQEWEALQALLVLESCMKKCGSIFHAEVSKFRFLNELIKLVSPKYMGDATPEAVRRRVLELMYNWTIQYPKETKIKEAYDMLKKQGVVKEEPPLSIRESKCKDQPSILQDEEKSLLLQKLLKSKNPDDLQAANRLIKSMVKEDERRVEEKWRQASELETAVNNCRLLKEMLDNWDPVHGSKQDLDLMKELHATCIALSPVLHRLASTVSEPAFCQSVIAANDEMGETLLRYNAVMKSSPQPDSLLDLMPSPRVEDTTQALANLDLEVVGNGGISSNGERSNEGKNNLLEDIFGSPPTTSLIGPTPQLPLSLNLGLEKSLPLPKENTKSKGLEELDLLGKSLLQESLLLSKNAQNKKPAKVTLNDLSLVSCDSSETSTKNSLLTDNDLLDLDPTSCTVAEPVRAASPKTDLPMLDVNLLPPTAGEVSTKTDLLSSDVQLLPLSVEGSAPKTDLPPSEAQPLPLADIKVTLESVKPSSVPPLTAIEERNGVSVVIFLAKDRPRPDVSVYIVTTTSKNQCPLTNFLFQPVVPKNCRLRLLPPSSCTLPAHNPFLPPSAITQIMLIASPVKVPIVLKFVISYVMDEETFTELGEISHLPLIDN